MKKILVPTDFSSHAFTAVKVAADIARRTGAELYLLHIIELPGDASDAVRSGYDIPEVLFFKNSAEKRLSEISLSPELNGLTVYQILKLGRTFSNVNEVAEENDANLIVMGSHGASGVKEMLIGSNTEKVVRSSNIPVLVIKENESELNFNRVVFACDFMSENITPYQRIISFFEANNIKPHFLMINTPNNFKPTHVANELIKEFMNKLAIQDFEYTIYNDTDVESGILNFTNNFGADLIAMGTHGRTGFSRLLNGSISEDLVNHSPLSVLTFKI